MFKKLPTKYVLKHILKKMSRSMGLKTYKNNQIFTKSSLKFLNVELEFYLFKSLLSEYYYDDLLDDKFESDNIENILDVYNDFFGLDNLIIAEFKLITPIHQTTSKPQILQNKKENKKHNTKKTNVISNEMSNDINYKIFNKIEFDNLSTDIKKIDQHNRYVLEF